MVGLGCGILVVGLSLLQANRSQWYVYGGDFSPSMKTLRVNDALLKDLPEASILPDDWGYSLKVVGDWWWWWMADEPERSRRLLWLANQRLRMGYELIADGNPRDGVTTLMKAEQYLQKAASASAVAETTTGMTDAYLRDALEWSISHHEDVLVHVETIVPEQLRPRVTVLKDVPKSL